MCSCVKKHNGNVSKKDQLFAAAVTKHSQRHTCIGEGHEYIDGLTENKLVITLEYLSGVNRDFVPSAHLHAC